MIPDRFRDELKGRLEALGHEVRVSDTYQRPTNPHSGSWTWEIDGECVIITFFWWKVLIGGSRRPSPRRARSLTPRFSWFRRAVWNWDEIVSATLSEALLEKWDSERGER